MLFEGGHRTMAQGKENLAETFKGLGLMLPQELLTR
jgi:hypothetical protein